MVEGDDGRTAGHSDGPGPEEPLPRQARRGSGRRGSALVLVVLAVLVNLPLAHSTWQRAQVQRSGVEVTAAVVDHGTVDGQDWVRFRLPEEVDPSGVLRRADVDASAYRSAVQSGGIRVRVMQDDPSAYVVAGEVRGRAPLVLTLLADALLLVLALLWWRYGGPRRPRLRAVALADVEGCEPETRLERLVAEDYLIRGEVVERLDDRVVLDVGNRTVEVLLDGHLNPVGQQQGAQVRARMIG